MTGFSITNKNLKIMGLKFIVGALGQKGHSHFKHIQCYKIYKINSNNFAKIKFQQN